MQITTADVSKNDEIEQKSNGDDGEYSDDFEEDIEEAYVMSLNDVKMMREDEQKDVQIGIPVIDELSLVKIEKQMRDQSN